MNTKLATRKPSRRRRRQEQEALAAQASESAAPVMDKKVDWTRCLPFILLHCSVLLVFVVGVSWVAVAACLVAYALRVFGLTAFYHRYFSHRSFKTTRWFQFVGAFIAGSAAQRGPLWWAAHHRRHHRESDQPADVHSPIQHGFWWSHMGWFMNRENYKTNIRAIKDFWKFPELRLLDNHPYIAPICLAVFMFALGELLAYVAPGLGTNGWQMLVWGFVVSTIAVYHVTYAINSLAHVLGKRRFKTKDDSRNNLVLALLTFGEGWHNNHHRYPASARQGFYWWEIDITFYILKILSWFRLIWELKKVPHQILEEGRRGYRLPAV